MGFPFFFFPPPQSCNTSPDWLGCSVYVYTSIFSGFYFPTAFLLNGWRLLWFIILDGCSLRFLKMVMEHAYCGSCRGLSNNLHAVFGVPQEKLDHVQRTKCVRWIRFWLVLVDYLNALRKLHFYTFSIMKLFIYTFKCLGHTILVLLCHLTVHLKIRTIWKGRPS